MAERFVVALVGGDTLLAKEIRELLDEIKPAVRVQLISGLADDSTVIAVVDDEAEVMLPLNAANLEGVHIAILAGSQASSRKAHKLGTKAGLKLIDLTGGLEERADARLRAPGAESADVGASLTAIIAAPAAIALTMALSKLSQVGTLVRTVAHVFEPASERGKRGVEELQKQTVAVLSFQKLKMDVFDTQVAFKMLAEYGEEAVEPLDGIEQRVERHLASLLSGWPAVPMPSVRVIQAPVFHGHSFSLWVEFEDSPTLKQLDGVADRVTADPNNSRAFWFWMTTDNLRLSAENAVAVAREMM